MKKRELEILNITKLIDQVFDDIINRNDNGLIIGNFIIKKLMKKGEKGFEYDGISISQIARWSVNAYTVLEFFRCSDEDNKYQSNSESTGDRYTIDIRSNYCVIEYQHEYEFYSDFVIAQDDIPYDSTASVEERKMSVDIAIDNVMLNEFMHEVIEFQSSGLKNINIIKYKHNLGEIDFMREGLYQQMIKRPYFKRLIK